MGDTFTVDPWTSLGPVCLQGVALQGYLGSGRREKNASTLLFSRVANRSTVGWPQIVKSRLVTLRSRDHSVERSNQRGFSI